MMSVHSDISPSSEIEIQHQNSYSKNLSNFEEMDEIVVTGVRPISKKNYPRSVSILDEEALFQLAAPDLPRALSYLPNVSFVSFAGSGKRARVDIRGSGDTSVSNIVVLEDGQRVGVRDLSGADFSTLPLDLIERIEVVRGGSAVRYGSGASQGVINIITRKAIRRNSWSIKQSVGDFGYSQTTAHYNFNKKRHGLFLFLANSETDGYRVHSRLLADSGQLSYRYETDNNSLLNLRYSRNSDEYELPGPLDLEAVNLGALDPRQASAGALLLGSLDQEKYEGSARIFFGEYATLDTLIGHLKRTDNTGMRATLTSTAIPGRTTNQIDTASTTLSFAAHSINFSLGLDFEKQSNVRVDRLQPSTFPFPINTAETWVNAGFSYLEITLPGNTNVGLGYRRDITKAHTFEQTLVSTLQQNISRAKWDNEAFEADIRLQRDLWSAFLSTSRTFRNPNSDELTLSNLSAGSFNTPLLDGPLRPQTAERYELGLVYESANLEVAASLFRSLTTQEIIFRTNSAAANVNGNLANTAKRQGAEFSFNYAAHHQLRLGASVGALSSRLGSGASSTSGHQQRIPLVPKLNASLNVAWHPRENISASINAQYIGSRPDGNDFDNDTPDTRLRSVVLSSATAKYSFSINDRTNAEVALGIDNLGDQRYATATYSGQGYPQPARSYNLSVKIGS